MIQKALIASLSLCLAMGGVITWQSNRLNTLRDKYDNVMVTANNCQGRIDDMEAWRDVIQSIDDQGLSFDSLPDDYRMREADTAN